MYEEVGVDMEVENNKTENTTVWMISNIYKCGCRLVRYLFSH